MRILFLHVYFCMRHVHIYVWLHHMHEISLYASAKNTQAGWWFQPLWKILVSWGYYSQYMEKSKCSKPPTRWGNIPIVCAQSRNINVVLYTISCLHRLDWSLPNMYVMRGNSGSLSHRTSMLFLPICSMKKVSLPFHIPSGKQPHNYGTSPCY